MNSKHFSALVFILSLFAFALQIAAQKAPAHRANYLFAYFKNNGEDGLHLAYSRDGLKCGGRRREVDARPLRHSRAGRGFPHGLDYGLARA